MSLESNIRRKMLCPVCLYIQRHGFPVIYQNHYSPYESLAIGRMFKTAIYKKMNVKTKNTALGDLQIKLQRRQTECFNEKCNTILKQNSSLQHAGATFRKAVLFRTILELMLIAH